MRRVMSLASSSSVSHQLKALEQKGFLRRDPNRPRALEVLLPGEDRRGAEPTRAPVAAPVRPRLVEVDDSGINPFPEPVQS